MRLKQRPRHFIREWRKHRGLNQEQLAARIESTQPTISRVESGVMPYDQGLLEALADALSCEPCDLLMRDPTQDEGIWSIWDRLGEGKRRQALKIIAAIAEDDQAA